ncbi:hypothetical protein [Devosia sp. A449]
MTKKIGNSIVLALVACVLVTLWAIGFFNPQAIEEAAAAPVGTGLNQRIIQSGHSLTDPIPPLLRSLAIAAGAEPDITIDGSTRPGSPMDQRWNEGPAPGMPDARAAIGQYDALVLTERVPLSRTIPWHNSAAEALRWFEHASAHGAAGQGAQTYLYATWVELGSGPGYDNPYDDSDGHIPWRQRLPREFSAWMLLADHVNQRRPSETEPLRVIPATMVLAAASDEIAAGAAPGLDDLGQLFSDEIHLSPAGAYLVALTHYTVIYDREPHGLPADPAVSPETATWMQSLVWDVVANFRAAETRRLVDQLTPAELQACLWQDLRGRSAPCVQPS